MNSDLEDRRPVFECSLLAAVAGCFLLPALAASQTFDVLARTPPTSIFVETDYSGNEGLAGCDWYASGSEILADAKGYGHGCQVIIRLRGTITSEGAIYFANLTERMANMDFRPATISLNSGGGNIQAAIRIARIIRSNEFFDRMSTGIETRVSGDEYTSCFSACVIIFAAGRRRTAEFDTQNAEPTSRIGIHSPAWFDSNTRAFESLETQSETEMIKRLLNLYFSSVGVSESIVDDMYAVPFDEIRLLSRRNLSAYGLD